MSADDIKNKAKEVNEKLVAKIGTKGRKLLVIGLAVIVVFSVIIALFLNHKEYGVLYSNVSSEEATEIVTRLQEMGVNYQYKENGDVLVDKKKEDTVRAQLAINGYPKNAFAYSTFIDNAGGMTTDSDKKTYKLYELQDRIGGTIRLFKGVKEAYVTIALGETQKYVLQDSSKLNESSAFVTMVMEDNLSPTAEQVAATQRLVAASVAGMKMENVVVVDGNGIDVSAQYAEIEGNTASSDEIARIVEAQVASKVLNVLGSIYGNDNVRVSVKASINMEELIRETLTYSTPDKIDINDKQGLVTEEELSEEMGEGVTGDGGVVGTETNSDITQYAGSGNNGNTSFSSSAESRKYAINQVKEQGQVPAGAVEDLTVAATVNSNDFGGLTQEEVRDLVANAAGIHLDNAEGKITVLSAPFYGATEAPSNSLNIIGMVLGTPWMLYTAIGILVFLLLLLLLILLIRRRRKKKKKKMMEAEAPVEEIPVQEEEPEKNPEIIKIQNEKAQGLRDSVRDFTEQNPEISAQLLKNWLNGGDQNGE